MSETWDLLVMSPRAAAYNMALDEALLRTASGRPHPLLRIYAWEGQPVTFGYFQKFPVELGWTGPVIRRPTGGGIVYHGDGVDSTYTVVAPAGHALHVLKTNDAYCALHKAVAAALALAEPLCRQSIAQKGQYQCFQNPVAGDVMAEGRKLAGGAQRRGKTGLLHQGSIAQSVSVEQLCSGFREVLQTEFVAYHPGPAELALADELTRTKYATEAWNRRIG